jgi:molybdopterin converting factor small subunit
MKVTVRFYAISRELAGTEYVTLDMQEPVRLEDVITLIYEKFPDLEPIRGIVRYAVDDEYAEPKCQLKNGQELSIIPPVSGG